MIRSNSTTEKLFRNAGVVEGMSILELGCGPGEVSELLSDMVGPDGQVVAVDELNVAIQISASETKCSFHLRRFEWRHSVHGRYGAWNV